jgi:hypothetical protein
MECIAGQPIFSWETQKYRFLTKDERANLAFANKVTQSLSIEADLDFVLGNCLQKQLFPEYGHFRDICVMWKWSMCPDEEVRSNCPRYLFESVKYEIDRRTDRVMVKLGRVDLFEDVNPKRIPASGLAFISRAKASFYTECELQSENDVLYMSSLPDFEGALGQRDSELLISYLTVPYLRIPLLLHLFSSDDRMSALKNQNLQKCLLYAVTECHNYVPTYILSKEELRLPADVPCSNPALIGTSHGLLLNELQHSPRAVLGPLLILVNWAIDKANLSVHDGLFQSVLFVARLASRVINVSEYLLSIWNGTSVDLEGAHQLFSNSENLAVLQEMTITLKSRLISHTEPTISGEGLSTLSNKLFERLQEIEYSSNIYCACGSSKNQGKFERHEEGNASNREDCHEEMFLWRIKTRNSIHAHIILMYGLSQKVGMPLCRDSCIFSLASVLFFMNNYTWNVNSLPVSDSEIISAVDQVRISAYRYLEHISEKDERTFTEVCQTIYERVSCDETSTGCVWKRVSGMKGKYVMLSTSTRQEELKFVKDGRYPVEFDLNTIEMRVRGGTLVHVDEDIARDRDVQFLLGENIGSLQCVHISSNSVCRQRKMIGVKIPVTIKAWSEENEMQDIGSYNEEYDPSLFGENDLWISELFEPVRSRFYTEKVKFFLDSDRNSTSAHMAIMCGVHEETSGAWFEVVLIKNLQAIQVYIVESYGRTFYRRLCYTNNTMLTFHQFYADSKSPRMPWEHWARYAGGEPRIPEPPFGRSCTVYRPLPDDVKEELYQSENPVHSAAGKENIETLKQLIADGADAQKADEENRSALDVACEHNSKESVLLLGLEMKKLHREQDIHRNLVLAIMRGKKAVAVRLIDVIANVDNEVDINTIEEIGHCSLDLILQQTNIEKLFIDFFR